MRQSGKAISGSSIGPSALYFCRVCWRHHRRTSKIGVAHAFFEMKPLLAKERPE